jgi:hypothetical protein
MIRPSQPSLRHEPTIEGAGGGLDGGATGLAGVAALGAAAAMGAAGAFAAVALERSLWPHWSQ